MQIRTETVITGVEVIARLQAAAQTDAVRADAVRGLRCAAERIPPKVWLTGLPATLSTAAEVSTDEGSGGTEVTVRLMWGPLPAWVPRVLTGAGLLAAAALLALSAGGVAAWGLAALAAGVPAAALLYQRAGERLLQTRLNDVLQGSGFTPARH